MPLLRTAALLLLLISLGVHPLFAGWGQDSGAAAAKNEGGTQPAKGLSGAEAVHGFLSDSAGPYSIFMALATAGVHQASDNPPDWRQGFPALSARFGSNMGITGVGNAVRYGVGWSMGADFRFRKCQCASFRPRLRHALANTVIARRRNGRAVLSLPNLIAPYAATTSAVYAWYPARYGMQDALRMGNYNLLGTLAGNIVFEFLPAKATNFLRRMHLGGSRVSTPPEKP